MSHRRPNLWWLAGLSFSVASATLFACHGQNGAGATMATGATTNGPSSIAGRVHVTLQDPAEILKNPVGASSARSGRNGGSTSGTGGTSSAASTTGQPSGTSGASTSGASGQQSGTSGQASGTSGQANGTSGQASGTSGTASGTSGEQSGTSGQANGTSGQQDDTSGQASGTSGSAGGTSGSTNGSSNDTSSISSAHHGSGGRRAGGQRGASPAASKQPTSYRTGDFSTGLISYQADFMCDGDSANTQAVSAIGVQLQNLNGAEQVDFALPVGIYNCTASVYFTGDPGHPVGAGRATNVQVTANQGVLVEMVILGGEYGDLGIAIAGYPCIGVFADLEPTLPARSSDPTRTIAPLQLTMASGFWQATDSAGNRLFQVGTPRAFVQELDGADAGVGLNHFAPGQTTLPFHLPDTHLPLYAPVSLQQSGSTNFWTGALTFRGKGGDGGADGGETATPSAGWYGLSVEVPVHLATTPIPQGDASSDGGIADGAFEPLVTVCKVTKVIEFMDDCDAFDLTSMQSDQDAPPTCLSCVAEHRASGRDPGACFSSSYQGDRTSALQCIGAIDSVRDTKASMKFELEGCEYNSNGPLDRTGCGPLVHAFESDGGSAARTLVNGYLQKLGTCASDAGMDACCTFNPDCNAIATLVTIGMNTQAGGKPAIGAAELQLLEDGYRRVQRAGICAQDLPKDPTPWD